MPSNKQVKRRSNTEILLFIKQLPGGNAAQYAKLLGTTSIRINALLNGDEGKKIVRAGMVCAPEKGKIPDWAITGKTERGALRARDVDRMYKDGTLPPFIKTRLEATHETFKDDALNFLREALEQTSNHTSFETQIGGYMDQTKHTTDMLVQSELRIAQYDREIERINTLIGSISQMQNMQQALLTAPNMVVSGGNTGNADTSGESNVGAA